MIVIPRFIRMEGAKERGHAPCRIAVGGGETPLGSEAVPGPLRALPRWGGLKRVAGRTIRRDRFRPELGKPQGLRCAAPASSLGSQAPLGRAPPRGSRSGAGWKKPSPRVVPASLV